MKIAILGGSDTLNDSPDYELAFRLATCLARAGHEITTAGCAGIAAAVAAGVRSIPDHIPQVLLDVGQAEACRHFFEEEVREDGYFVNLQAIVMWPDVHIFFPGNQGTRMQLQALLHMMDKNTVPMSHPIIICEAGDGLALFRLARDFMDRGRSTDELTITITRDPGRICEQLDQAQVSQEA